jgi:pentatricopeptide repeat protein
VELFEEMQRRGVQPNVITWNAAISACAKGAQWERAVELFEEMQRRGVQPDVITWSAAISACEQSGLLEQAIDLFLKAQSIGIFSLWLSPATIDLHDLSLSVARAAVASVLADVSLQPSDRPFFDTSISTTLTIVTGRGNRSDDNEAVLRPGILAMLQSEYPELDSTINRENDGSIDVMVKKQRIRPGSWTGASGRQ